MRKSFVFVGLVAAVLMGAAPAFAQKIDFGAKLGPQWSTVTNVADTGETTSMRAGLAIGGFVTFKVANMVEIQPEVMFSQEGVKFHSGTMTATAKLDYIQIPILLRLGNLGHPGVYGLFGPSFGGMTSGKLEASGQPTVDLKSDGDVKGSATSLIFGGGYSMKHTLIEASYQVGLTDINKDNTSSNASKGRTFTLLFGVHGSKK